MKCTVCIKLISLFILNFLANPVCKEVGCGKWSPPMISNPAYKGKWHAPMISNPNYMVCKKSCDYN